MGTSEFVSLGLAVLSGLLSVIWYLLQAKDASQAKEIDILFKKHHENAEALVELKLKLASRHYEKSELDTRFDKLEQTCSAGFASLGAKFDKINDALSRSADRKLPCATEACPKERSQ